ncbi:MAG: hypothetical protein OXG85_05825 [Chloroflexi bacterium]|nr:hypothetical protein [Chloroflexota bacterium]
MFKRSLILCGAILAVALVLSLVKSPDDWSEPCSDYELQQARAGERFDPFHVALTQEQYSRVELRRLRQTVWQDLPLCRELVEFVALSLELYNDRLFVEAAPALSDSVLDPKEYDRWYELFLRVLGDL